MQVQQPGVTVMTMREYLQTYHTQSPELLELATALDVARAERAQLAALAPAGAASTGFTEVRTLHSIELPWRPVVKLT